MAADPEKEALRAQWTDRYKRASQADSWGQVVEAQEEYRSLANVIASKQGELHASSRDKELMRRLCLCLSTRIQALDTLNETITAADMKALEPCFEVLFQGREIDPFPVDPQKFSNAPPVWPSSSGDVMCESEDMNAWHRQQAVMKTIAGTAISLQIDRFGLKDAQDYIDPFMTILVADPNGIILDTHDTPIARDRTATYVNFHSLVFLNISMEDMQRHSAAIFFEFKHYKPKKKKVSTRAWAFMELLELKRDEEIVLEIYHKPTDLRKKSLKLHSEKPLYCHLHATYT